MLNTCLYLYEIRLLLFLGGTLGPYSGPPALVLVWAVATFCTFALPSYCDAYLSLEGVVCIVILMRCKTAKDTGGRELSGISGSGLIRNEPCSVGVRNMFLGHFFSGG